MRRFSSQDPLAPLIGVFVIVVGLVVALVILPVRSKAAQQEHAAQQLRAKLSDAEKLNRSLPALKKECDDLRAQITSLSRPGPNPTPDVVREIERLTSDLGLRLLSIRPSDPQLVDNCTKFPTQFDVQSNFDKIVKLLYELEQSPNQQLWVEGVEMNSDQSGGLRTSVTVDVFTCKPGAEIKTDKKPDQRV